MISDANVKILLNQPEWTTFECKRALVEPAKLLDTIVAFANTDGGYLVIGLEDPNKARGLKRLVGISERPDSVSEFLKLVEKEIEPPGIIYKKYELGIVNNIGKPDKLVVIKIDKSNGIYSLKNGDTFVRRGSQNIKIGVTEIVRLGYEKGSIKFEDERSNITTLDDLNYELLELYKADLESKETNNQSFLRDNKLAVGQSNEFKLTKAGVLLFGNNPSVLLGSKCGIKVSHYYGNQPNYSGEPNFVERPLTIEGPLLHQIKQAMEYFRKVVKSSPPKLRGALFHPSFLVPEWVFQEAVTNAVVHRNYSVQNDIQIRFFDNRVEIESPGTYPGPITVENIRRERFARNPVILRTLNRFKVAPNMDIGEGVDRMYKVMDEHNLYEPLYAPPATRPYSVLLILFNIQKIEYWDVVSRYLDKNYRITNMEARKVTGMSDMLRMSRFLHAWVKQGLLEMIGKNKREIYYRRPGQKIPEVSLSSGYDNETIA